MSDLINRAVDHIVIMNYRSHVIHPVISDKYITLLNEKIQQLTNPFDKIFIHTLTNS